MKTKQLLESGQLSAAVAELTQQVKAHPTDTHLRTFLFELLCFQGDYQRAIKQLDVIGLKDEQTGVGVAILRKLLQAEDIRRQVFDGTAQPTFLLDPPPSVQHQLDGIACVRQGKASDAKVMFAKVEALQPRYDGQVNGKPFSLLRDSDDRISAVLEVFINNTYTWIPFEQLRMLKMDPPKHLRDVLWAPVSIELENGQGGEALVPVLYAGSEREDNEQVRLGRLTEWIDLGEGIAGGVGQRTVMMDSEEMGFLEIRELTIRCP